MSTVAGVDANSATARESVACRSPRLAPKPMRQRAIRGKAGGDIQATTTWSPTSDPYIAAPQAFPLDFASQLAPAPLRRHRGPGRRRTNTKVPGGRKTSRRERTPNIPSLGSVFSGARASRRVCCLDLSDLKISVRLESYRSVTEVFDRPGGTGDGTAKLSVTRHFAYCAEQNEIVKNLLSREILGVKTGPPAHASLAHVAHNPSHQADLAR